MFMWVPCWKLADLHRVVRSKPQGAGMVVAPGYLAVMRDATRLPAGRSITVD